MADPHFDFAARAGQAEQVIIFRLRGQRDGKSDRRDGSRQNGAAEALFNCMFCMFHFMFSLDLSSEGCAGWVIAPVYPGMAIHAGFTHCRNCCAPRSPRQSRAQIPAFANTFSLMESYVAR